MLYLSDVASANCNCAYNEIDKSKKKIKDRGRKEGKKDGTEEQRDKKGKWGNRKSEYIL